jgi:hypothetical protein
MWFQHARMCFQHAQDWFLHAEYYFHTQSVIFTDTRVILTRMRVNMTLTSVITWFIHAEYNFHTHCDFDTDECDNDTPDCDFNTHKSVFRMILTRTSVTYTRTSWISIFTSLKHQHQYYFNHIIIHINFRPTGIRIVHLLVFFRCYFDFHLTTRLFIRNECVWIKITFVRWISTLRG